MTDNAEVIILTNQYPYEGGDTPFVQTEMAALSEAFERVHVVTISSPKHSRTVHLPSNARSERIKPVTRRLSSFFGVLSLPHLCRLLGFILEEWRERRAAVRWPRLFRSSVVAIRGGALLDALLDEVHKRGGRAVVYAFWGTDCAMPVLASRRKAERYAIRFHGYDLYEERVGYLPFRRHLFDRADIILTVSGHGAEYLTARYPREISPEKVEVARLGTSDHGRGLGSPERVIRIVSCSAIIPLKRVDLIFNVLCRLSNWQPIEWVHFGDGPNRSDLERMIMSAGPNLTVEFKGQVPNECVIEYYSTHPISAFVNLSTSEGVPVSIMEAMSFGIPILATDVGGTGEIVAGEVKSGHLVPVDADADEIAESLRLLLASAGQFDPRRVWESYCDADINGGYTAALLMESNGNKRL